MTLPQLCYHCGADVRGPHYHKGMPYCGMCAIKFGYLDDD